MFFVGLNIGDGFDGVLEMSMDGLNNSFARIWAA